MPDTLGNVVQPVNDTGDSADWLNQKVGLGNQPTAFADTSEIKRHMEVVSSCGCIVGVVDEFDDGEIRLTRKDDAKGQHHYIPTGWIQDR